MIVFYIYIYMRQKEFRPGQIDISGRIDIGTAELGVRGRKLAT
jgi:hypothetical protein